MKKRKLNFLITLCSIVISTYNISAQPIIEWEKNFGGPGFDIANSVQQTMDQGYINAGYSETSFISYEGEKTIWILKLDSEGNLEWEKKIGGPEDDQAFSIQQTIGQGYIIAGYTHSIDGVSTPQSSWILKLDSEGNLEWEKKFGEYLINARSIQQTIDGGYIITGSTSFSNVASNGSFDFLILKLDSGGNLEWEKNYGGSYHDAPYSIQQTIDQGYIIAGMSYSSDGDVDSNNGESDVWIVKLDVEGNLEWEKNYGGSKHDRAYSIQQTTNGGYIFAAQSKSSNLDVGQNNGDNDFWIVKLDSEGIIEWEKNYGGSENDSPYSIQQTMDGKYIVAGETNSNNVDVNEYYGLTDVWILKLDSEGNLEWEKNYGGSDHESARSIQQTIDGKYILVGNTRSNDGNISVNYGGFNIWVVKLSPLPVSLSYPILEPEFTISPNPSSGQFKIQAMNLDKSTSVNIIDGLGRSIYKKDEFYGELNIENLPKGQYFIKMKSGRNKYNSKLFVY